ncbi:hypothetical protein V1477_011428 [Vespula maculifrons]|uniref:Uncharacterized protein n=1 Tax=Vespula maculifrons TaxID=7453 RepID=A0ABD2BZ62_VESMC
MFCGTLISLLNKYQVFGYIRYSIDDELTLRHFESFRICIITLNLISISKPLKALQVSKSRKFR